MNKFRIAMALAAAIFIFASCGTGTAEIKGDGRNETADEAGAKPGVSTAKVTPQEYGKLAADSVLTIGNYTLTRSKYEVLKKYMQERFDYKLTGDQEKEFIEYIVNKKLMAMEARGKGYADKSDLQTRYEWDFDDILSHAYYNDIVDSKSKVTEEDGKKYYEKNKDDFVEIKAQHILIKNKEMAENIHKRIAAGENFDDLAKKYSEDATTKDSGGNLGFFGKGVMVEEFESAAFALSQGEVSEPVKTIYGYHIIKVNEKRKISYDDSKDKIIKMIADKKQKDLFDSTVNDLKKKYKVTVNETLIK
jgi:peptidyl-prolyl cis-trans isomerase C